DLGYQRLHMGRFDQAIPWLEQAESKAGLADAERVRERGLGNLGWCYYRLGDFDRALHSLSAAVSLAKQIEDDYLYRWLNDLGNVYLSQRDFSRAIDNYQVAADLARRAGNMTWLTVMLNNLTATSFEQRDVAAADRFNTQARALIQKNPNSQSLLHSQFHGARIEATRKHARAESSFRAVIAMATGIHEPFVRWEAHAGLAQLLPEHGREAEADAEFRNALITIE